MEEDVTMAGRRPPPPPPPTIVIDESPDFDAFFQQVYTSQSIIKHSLNSIT